MNASQFMDKQIQGLAASGAAAPSPPAPGGLADLMSPDPQEEAESHAHRPHHGAANGADEVLPSYDFQPIRPATSASASAVPVGSAPAAGAWGSLDSKAASPKSLKVYYTALSLSLSLSLSLRADGSADRWICP
jgi:L-tryptophan--pyruvate aminotransferase